MNAMMSLWYVYDSAGKHVGPVTTDLLARGIVAGKVPREAHVGAVGSASWLPVLEVPEVVLAVRRAESIPPPSPSAAATMVMPRLVKAEELVKVEDRAKVEEPALVPPKALVPAGVPAPGSLVPLGIFGASFLVSVALFAVSVFLRR